MTGGAMYRITTDCRPQDDGWRCDVAVDDGRTSGRHAVTVSAADALRLAGAIDDEAAGRLVYETFAFLLEREPRSSILTTFDLSEVRRYFPEFESEMASRLAP